MSNKKNTYFIGMTIVLAGIFIAGSVMYSAGAKGGGDGFTSAIDVAPVTEEDHIRGSVDALVTVIEYSDFECPFCRVFHGTMKEVFEGYDGQVAWAYRHFPLESIHPKAVDEAVAAECVAELGGDEAFWSFADRVFEVTPSNNGLELETLPDIAEYAGVDRDSFIACQEDNDYRSLVDEQYEQALNAGGRGTPYIIVVGPEGETRPLTGAQSAQTLRNTIDGFLDE